MRFLSLVFVLLLSTVASAQSTLGPLLGTNGPLTAEHVDSSVELGVTWIRTDAEWGAIHATEAAYNADVAAGGVWPAFRPFRDRVTYAHSRGLKVLAVVMGGSAWARGTDRTDGFSPWHQAILPTKRVQFATYVKNICLAGADAVEITNEPNLKGEYYFGPSHPRAAWPAERNDDYVLLLKQVYTTVKADPLTATCQVGIGGTAIGGHEQIVIPDVIHPTTWYAKLFSAKADDRTTSISALGSFDFAAVHPYPEANVGAGPTEWGNQWQPQYGDSAYYHGIAIVGRIREVLLNAGVSSQKVWATEVGSATINGTCTSRPCVYEELQAEWLRQYIKAWFSQDPTGYRQPLALRFYGGFTGPMFVYQWRDKSNGIIAPLDKEGFFGLQTYDGRNKPAFKVLQDSARLPR